jgi:hypothetical protein
VPKIKTVLILKKATTYFINPPARCPVGILAKKSYSITTNIKVRIKAMVWMVLGLMEVHASHQNENFIASKP